MHVQIWLIPLANAYDPRYQDMKPKFHETFCEVYSSHKSVGFATLLWFANHTNYHSVKFSWPNNWTQIDLINNNQC